MRFRSRHQSWQCNGFAFFDELPQAAVGRRFVAKGITVRAGRKQIFAKAELFSENEQGDRTLVATGDTLMVQLDV